MHCMHERILKDRHCLSNANSTTSRVRSWLPPQTTQSSRPEGFEKVFCLWFTDLHHLISFGATKKKSKASVFPIVLNFFLASFNSSPTILLMLPAESLTFPITRTLILFSVCYTGLWVGALKQKSHLHLNWLPMTWNKQASARLLIHKELVTTFSSLWWAEADTGT